MDRETELFIGCRMLVGRKLEEADWDEPPHVFNEQTSVTDGRIIVPEGKPRRLKKTFSDFLLRNSRDITLAVVEPKSDRRPAGEPSGDEWADFVDMMAEEVQGSRMLQQLPAEDHSRSQKRYRLLHRPLLVK